VRAALRRRDAGPRRLFFLLVAIPMLFVFPYLRATNNPNEYVRVFTAMSLVEEGTFAIDGPVRRFGWVNDMSAPRKTGGHYYMVKAPGAVYLGVPGYFIYSKIVAPLLGKKYPAENAPADVKTAWLRDSTWALRLFGTQIPCFLFLLWFERYLRAFSGDASIRYAAVAACGLGTNYLAYTHMFASHAQYAAVAFLGFGLIESESRRARGVVSRIRLSRALLAGFCVSATVALEYHALFLAVLLSIYALVAFWSPRQSWNPSRILAFGVGGLLNVPPMMWFHWKAYGNPLTPGHQMLETEKFAIEHQTGLWGVIWPTWEHVRDLSFSPDFGFFGMSPYMAIGFAGFVLAVLFPKARSATGRSVRTAALVAFLAGTLLVLVNAGIIEWRAGWTVGPRYLAACPPIFAFLAVIGLERIAAGRPSRRAFARGLGGGLALASVISIGTVGLLYDTLPDNIERPFTNFAVPLIVTGHVPHHVGEWFGWDSITLWYIACAALLLAPIVAALWRYRGDTRRRHLATIGTFVVALAIGMVPAFTRPLTDGNPFAARMMQTKPFFALHHSALGFVAGWEPPGRDRLTTLRHEAERYGTRGRGPCLWHRVATYERLLGMDDAARRDEARAGSVRADQCPKTLF
jgi:hypothetical protein